MTLRALTFSRGIQRIPCLPALLGVDAVVRPSPGFVPDAACCVIGWGLKRNTHKARRFARARDIPFLTVEDGFLRSVDLGVRADPPLSVVVDDIGIYYDATRPSRLECLLNGAQVASLPIAPAPGKASPATDPLEDATLLSRARTCMARIVAAGLSKYNSSPDETLPVTDRPRVLVVDQTAGDLSIVHGLAGPDSFARMLEAALAEHPQAEILVKVHPDVVAGRKRGHLLAAAGHPRVRLLNSASNPAHLVRQVRQVYVVTSLTGFEALLAGTPVTCFGAPFYAGWGLTDDRVPLPRRRQARSLEQVFAAAYLLYARYRHPDTGAPCAIEPVIEHLALQRRLFAQNAGTLFCVGFTLWKRGYVRRYLRCPWNRVYFVRTAWRLRRLRPGSSARLVVWGMRAAPALLRLAETAQLPVWRMEDGFLRSVGLGSDLTAPASLVLDRCGIYFDPARPSDLEQLLEHQQFSADELALARVLRENIVNHGVSKYNVGQQRALQHGAQAAQQVILVPGQVEDDASIQQGCLDIRTNAALLQAVRERHPDAWIIYKPHPDVLSGNRDAVTGDTRHAGYDQLVTDTGIAQCLDAADEVHTMTSLVGFEGLLRGKRVVTYGLPFYAGWGLTVDRHRSARRTRVLKLDELVAGSLLRYPRYLNVATGRFSTADIILDEFVNRRSAAARQDDIVLPVPYRIARRVRNLLNGIFYAR